MLKILPPQAGGCPSRDRSICTSCRLLLGMCLPLRFRLVVRRYTGFCILDRQAIVVQLDIPRLKSFYVALLQLWLRTHETTHRQCRGGDRFGVLGFTWRDKLGLAPESNLARHFVPRCFPKVESACVCDVRRCDGVCDKKKRFHTSCQPVCRTECGTSELHLSNFYSRAWESV
jgi:hypothetical protein